MIPSPDLLPDEPMPAPQRPMRRAPQDAQNNAATRGASSTACRRRTDDSPEKCSTRRPHNMPHPRLPRHPAARTIPPPHFSRRPQFRRLRADRRASPNALSEATFIRVRSAGLQFSARPRSSRAQPPPCFRSPGGFRLLPRALLSPCSPRSIPRLFLRLPRSSAALYPAFLRLICEKASRSLRRCAKPLQCRASSRTAPRPAQQLPRNVFRRSQLANIKQLLRFRRDCDHAFIAVRSPFPIPRCRARQRFFRIFSSRNPLL